MILSVAEIYTQFFDKMERDGEFFQYYSVSVENALALAKERSLAYLREAILYLKRKTEITFRLGIEMRDGEWFFVEAITEDEADILTEIMLMRCYRRQFAELQPKINVFSATDMKMLYSPSNERKTYVAMIAYIENNIWEWISNYAAKERLTGKHKTISYNIPTEEE